MLHCVNPKCDSKSSLYCYKREINYNTSNRYYLYTKFYACSYECANLDHQYPDIATFTNTYGYTDKAAFVGRGIKNNLIDKYNTFPGAQRPSN
jgi:hypothetical protein